MTNRINPVTAIELLTIAWPVKRSKIKRSD